MIGSVSPPVDMLPTDLVQSHISRACGEFAVDPGRLGRARRERLRAQIETGALGRFETVTVAQDAERVIRDRPAIRREPRDHYYLLVQLQGRAVIEQDDQPISLTEGEMCLVDSTRPSVFRYGGAFSRQLSLHLPRAEIDHRFRPQGRPRFALMVDDPLSVPIRSVVARMAEAEAAEARGLGEALLGLMGAWFAARAAGDTAGRNQQAARQVIARRAADPEFGPAELAAALGLTPRALQRLFQPLGQTPGRAIIEERLERALLRLSGSDEAIAVIAFDCGFNDLSYFYREFRRRYGHPPGEVQRRALSHFSKSRASMSKPPRVRRS